MIHGFVKVAAASPRLKVADCPFNACEIVNTAKQAAQLGVKLLVLPELSITSYTCGDLFLQPALLDSAIKALLYICDKTKKLDLLLFVGLPMRHRGKLYNCAAAVFGGHVLGFTPKTHVPNYNEFYEIRHFTPAPAENGVIDFGPFTAVPIGTKLLFSAEGLPGMIIGAEICEDLWVPSPPSACLAAAGATVVVNLSASNEIIGKAEYRRQLVESQSARLACAYLYADAGMSESTTDLVFSGHNCIAENGVTLAQSPLFSGEMAVTDIDLQHLAHERARMNTFPRAARGYTVVPFAPACGETPLLRHISPTPFVPEGAGKLDARCEVILSIQAHGLAKRLGHTGSRKAVIGISGGLDSSLALLVTVRAFQLLNRPMEDILAVTMPAFGTTGRTKQNAGLLCKALGVSFIEIPITEQARLQLASIGHNTTEPDITFENAQARVRTLVLMNLANRHGGLVVGTGDLSELALGWATYNGDHMSMYGVNAGVPKTLIRYIIGYEAQNRPELESVLSDILNTPVSPELLPAVDGEISQKTEDIVGPYELHDFFLYHVLRWASPPDKVYRMAVYSLGSKYDEATIKKWLKIFYRRFFSQQFKRSCMPDGPKVGSVGLSPRGDWRMPSDASADVWLSLLEDL